MRAHPGSKGHPPELREQAAAMRREGRSRAGIARELDVGFATVARWFREDGVPAPRPEPGRRYVAQLDAVQERWDREQLEQDSFRDVVGPLSDRELMLLGTAIYWAEGAKSKPWARAHRLSFINSDRTMIDVFLAYLALVGVPRDQVTCRLHIHESADVAAAEDYWRSVVGTGVIWLRTTLKRHNVAPSRHNTGGGYRGCLSVCVRQSAKDYRRIAGTWDGIAGAIVAASRSPVV